MANLTELYHPKLLKLCKTISVISEMNVLFVTDNYGIEIDISVNGLPLNLYKDFELTILKGREIGNEDSSPQVRILSLPMGLNFISIPAILEKTKIGTMILGPYLSELSYNPTQRELLGDKNLPQSVRDINKLFYDSLNILNQNKIENITTCVSVMISNIQSIPEKSIEIEYKALENEGGKERSSANREGKNDLNLDSIERRYRDENQLIKAVETGNYNRAKKLLQERNELGKEFKRLPNDPLRSYKDLTFVLNTLLRKAVEKAGVHPIYIDGISGKYAVLIEKITRLQQVKPLSSDMVFDYCQLVNKLSVDDKDSFIRKLIEYIRLNLNQDLSLNTLSQVMNSSPSNISRRFKKGTGESIIRYINNLRIKESELQLEDDSFSITEIALSVGFNDINYFTRIFKMKNGITPSDFRKRNSPK